MGAIGEKVGVDMEFYLADWSRTFALVPGILFVYIIICSPWLSCFYCILTCGECIQLVPLS